jgi:hypothetical protein
MPARDESKGDARCPSCRSASVFKTTERFGVETFFCADCEHVWEATRRAPASGGHPDKPRLAQAVADGPAVRPLPALVKVVRRAEQLRQQALEAQERTRELQRRCDAAMTAAHRMRQFLRAEAAWGPNRGPTVIQ